MGSWDIWLWRMMGGLLVQVWGENDGAAPASDAPVLAEIYRSYSACQLVVVPGGKHLVAVERPAVVADAVLRFMDTHSGVTLRQPSA